MKRRNLLALFGAGLASGCARIGQSDQMRAVFGWAEDLHEGAHRALAPRKALAREFAVSDISPSFRGNGTVDPGTPGYAQAAATGFAGWTLAVRGLVERELALDLAAIRSLPQRTQITRHDCVEGWSAIGQWTGPQLATILAMAGVRGTARYAVFRCADRLNGADYYESVDMDDAFHPQTIVAHALNGAPLPVRNGAPLRMRIERQLGYKHAKYLTSIELVSSLDGIEGGNGGYWEDRGYNWYAGI